MKVKEKGTGTSDWEDAGGQDEAKPPTGKAKTKAVQVAKPVKPVDDDPNEGGQDEVAEADEECDEETPR